MTNHPDDLWPTELRIKEGGTSLSIRFEDGTQFDLPAEYLRVESPSAEVQGHSAAERKTIAGKRNIHIEAAVPVGNYAVKLVFDDGHDSGLFTWAYFHELGRRYPEKWQAYVAALAAKGLSRS